MSYRAGNVEPNQYYQQLIKDIREGNTPGQRARAFKDKAMVGAGMAALAGAGGIASGIQSKMDSDKRDTLRRNEATMRGAIASQTAQRDNESRIRGESAQYAAPERQENPYGPQPDGQQDGGHPTPEWLKNEMGDGAGVDMSLRGQSALAAQRLNSSAADTQFGGYDTSVGLQNKNDQSDMLSRDIATANQGIQEAGGMMNSLRRDNMRPQ